MNRSACGRMRVLFTWLSIILLFSFLFTCSAIPIDGTVRQTFLAVTLLCCPADSLYFWRWITLSVNQWLTCQGVWWLNLMFSHNNMHWSYSTHWQYRRIDSVACKHALLRAFNWFQHTLTPIFYSLILTLTRYPRLERVSQFHDFYFPICQLHLNVICL